MEGQFAKLIFGIPAGNLARWLRWALLVIYFGVGGFTAAETYAQPPNFRWIRQAGGGSPNNNPGFNYFRGMAFDPNGNSVAVGFLDTTNPAFVSPQLTNYVPPGNFLARYDSAGNLLKTESYGTNVTLQDVVLDSSGNIYVTGSTNFSIGPASNLLLTKYDPLGNVIWSTQSSPPPTNSNPNYPRNTYGQTLALDAAGNIYVNGIFYAPLVSFGGFTLTNDLSSPYGDNEFLAKFDSAGNPLWVRQISGINSGFFIKPVFDASGNVVFAATLTGTGRFGGVTPTNIATGDICLATFDPVGNLLGVKDVATGRFLFPFSLTMDSTGNYLLSGNFASPTATFGNVTLTNHSGFNEVFLVELDSGGNPVWVRQGGSPGSDNYGGPLFADAAGNIYQSGVYGSANFTLAGTQISSPNGTMGTAYVAKYDLSGNVLWITSIGGFPPPLNVAYTPLGVSQLAGDVHGNIYLAGIFNTPGAIFGNLTVTALNNGEIFFAKLDGPQLNLQTTNSSVVVSWPTNATGLSLESTANLAGGWSPVTNLPTAVGNQFVITNSVASGSQFYRLRNF